MIDSIVNYAINRVPIFFLLVANWVKIRTLAVKLKKNH